MEQTQYTQLAQFKLPQGHHLESNWPASMNSSDMLLTQDFVFNEPNFAQIGRDIISTLKHPQT